MSKIKGICYKSPHLGVSGYSKAARGYILSLHKLGIPLTLSPMNFDNETPDLGKDGDVLHDLINKDIDYDTVIMHCTPEFYSKYREEGKVNIGYTIWECDRLHKEWPDLINNSVDKLMVATDWNIKVFRDSGVTVPLCSIPHVTEKIVDVEPYNITGIDDSTYVFGFVGQWVERKDPISLIKAYWYAFKDGVEDVALVMKTYRSDYSEQEKQAIITTIQRLKQVTILDNYPKIYLISEMLSEDEMRGLYKRIDCYTTLDRGEGWALGNFQAGALGKPVIGTGFGGVNAYMKKDNSYLLNYTLEPVFGMPFNRWMTADMLWAHADLHDGSMKMREVFENQEAAKEKGRKLQEYIHTNFSYEVIGKKIIKEIEEVL